MTFFENETITITYDETRQLVQTEWHGFAPSEEYRKIMEIYLQLAKEKPVRRWIGNNTQAKAIRPIDQEWTVRDWAPRFSQAGSLEKMAVVVAQDFFNKMAVENMFIKGIGVIRFDTRYFKAMEDALAWVME